MEIKIKFENYSYFRIDADDYIMRALQKFLRYFVPGAQFSQPYRMKRWDGFKSFITQKNRIPLGSLEKTLAFIKKKFLVASVEIAPEYYNKIQDSSFLKDIEVYSKGERIIPRENQWQAINICIKNNRCVCVAPTSFGKSLVIYLLCRYHLNYNRKVIIVCPKQILVDQMIADFRDYGYDGAINGIYSGKEKTTSDITVATYQTLVKIPEILNSFDCLIQDECHQSKANSILSIIDKATKVKFKYGLTGSLKPNSIEYIFASTYIGFPHYITDTRTLMQEEVVAKLQVSIYRYIFPPSEMLDKRIDYQEERKKIGSADHRYKAILEEAGRINKTGMIAVVEIEQAQMLYEMARGMYPDRIIYQIRGGHIECNEVMYDSFEEIKPDIEKHKNALLIVGLKVFSTGVSIKNIHFGIMAVSTKSYTSVIQTIGRGLRINKTKKDFLFIDWFDDFRKNINTESYAYKHLRDRIVIYKEQGFEVSYYTVGEEQQNLLKGLEE